MATGCQIPVGTPPENIIALMDAASIGADGYAENATKAVRLVKRLLSQKGVAVKDDDVRRAAG